MKTLFAEIKTSVGATLILVGVLCGLYPFAVWVLGSVLFPDKAKGSLVADASGVVRGSALLGQPFAGEHYFHSRPSSAGAGYDAANSSGSNLGPTSQKLADTLKVDIDVYRKRNGLAPDVAVPADAVTRSASGLDPHISRANAELQAARVAKARNLPVERVRKLIYKNTDERALGLLGEPGVNVLRLNLALDQAATVAGQ